MSIVDRCSRAFRVSPKGDDVVATTVTRQKAQEPEERTQAESWLTLAKTLSIQS